MQKRRQVAHYSLHLFFVKVLRGFTPRLASVFKKPLSKPGIPHGLPSAVNSKSQVPNHKLFCLLKLGSWNLFGIWCLIIGIFHLVLSSFLFLSLFFLLFLFCLSFFFLWQFQTLILFYPFEYTPSKVSSSSLFALIFLPMF